jgi:hypothetical protein
MPMSIAETRRRNEQLRTELARVTAERDRLRGYANSADDVADNLRGQLSEALEALEPFAKLWAKEMLSRVGGDAAPVWETEGGRITVGDIRKASGVLARLRKEPNSEGS